MSGRSDVLNGIVCGRYRLMVANSAGATRGCDLRRLKRRILHARVTVSLAAPFTDGDRDRVAYAGADTAHGRCQLRW